MNTQGFSSLTALILMWMLNEKKNPFFTYTLTHRQTEYESKKDTLNSIMNYSKVLSWKF